MQRYLGKRKELKIYISKDVVVYHHPKFGEA